jgi:hypothetical protein
MLLVCALAMVAACSEKDLPQKAPSTSPAQAADQRDFNPADSEEEWKAKAEARGAAQAKNTIRDDAVAEQSRGSSDNAGVGTVEQKDR